MRKLKNDELGRLDLTDYKAAEKHPIVIVLDNVRSMHNVGSAFRTADAFRVEKIFLCGITATPPHRDIHKTALGATESVEWEYIDKSLDVVDSLRQQKYSIQVVEQAEGSTMLQDFIPEKDKKLAFFFGNEIHGVSQDIIEMADKVLEIPQYGTKHSVNISVSIGIVIWDVFTKMELYK